MMSAKKLNDKQGSALVAALFIAVVLGLWMAAAMQSSYTEYKMSTRHLGMQSAFNLAESGLEEGVRAFNSQNWTNWTSYGSGYFRSIPASWVDSGYTGTIKIFVSNNPSSPSIAAEGALTGADGNPIVRQIKVELSSGSLYANGLLARRQIIMNGNGVTVDSYDSRIGSGEYTPTSWVNRFSNGNIATLDVYNTNPLLNNADIYGKLSVGVSEDSFNLDQAFHKNGTLGVWGGPTGFKDTSRVAYDFYVDLPPVPTPSYGTWTDVSVYNGGNSEVSDSLTLGNPTDTSPAEYQAERISLSGNGEVLTIDGPVKLYVRRNVSISGKGGIHITENGSLELYVATNVSISGNGSAYGLQNETKKPEKFMLYNCGSGTNVDISGNGLAYCVVYAPNSVVHLQGGGSSGSVFGAIVGLDITLNGGYEFHYDEALADLGGSGGLEIDFWRELKAVGERLPFDNPTELATHF